MDIAIIAGRLDSCASDSSLGSVDGVLEQKMLFVNKQLNKFVSFEITFTVSAAVAAVFGWLSELSVALPESLVADHSSGGIEECVDVEEDDLLGGVLGVSSISMSLQIPVTDSGLLIGSPIFSRICSVL